MTNRPRIGLLPLYLKLYDETRPALRAEFEPLLASIATRFAGQGVDVERAPVCRVAAEFLAAIADLEKAGVDCLVTLHLAYSPSLEAIEPLLATPLPLILLDTTMDPAFGPETNAARIMYNHGIHGVMDLASMLRRHGRTFQIVAGHYAESDAIPRAADLARAAQAARRMRAMRVLRVGPPFEGMGDFSVEEYVLLDKLGIRVEQIDAAALIADAVRVPENAIDAEIESDRAAFDCTADPATHAASVRVGLALRQRIDSGPFGACSVNFLAFDRADGPPVPFLEISKSMARGIGYAGEGDVLTASLVGALAGGFGRATFTEIFCPDWRGNSLFLSHMGEISPSVIEGRPRLARRPFPFTPAPEPIVLTGPVRTGPAVFANLAPGPDESFSLILAPVEVLPDTSGESMRDTIRAWIRPVGRVADFLETYGRLGGTHHSALILGNRLPPLRAFADFLGVPCHTIE